MWVPGGEPETPRIFGRSTPPATDDSGQSRSNSKKAKEDTNLADFVFMAKSGVRQKQSVIGTNLDGAMTVIRRMYYAFSTNQYKWFAYDHNA